MAKCWKCLKRARRDISCLWCGRGPMCLNCKCDCNRWPQNICDDCGLAHCECQPSRVITPASITLDRVLRLPMAGRIRRGFTTVCDACRLPITDEYFYGGFATGHKNLLLHEHCTPEDMRTAALTNGK